uniref:Uncharacterized protein n=1 Tax=Acrobeloides nanus TaxID=290746 RepID=A0A914DFD3_9BILA
MGQKSADLFLSSYNIGKVPVYDARDFPIVGEVEPSSMKHPLLHELSKLKETIHSIERNINQQTDFKDLDRVAEVLHKTNILLRDKLGITQAYTSSAMDEMPV